MNYYNYNRYRRSALLPTGTKMNPAAPETAEYYHPNQVIYVMKNKSTGAQRVFTSFGHIGWEIGSVHEIEHDQTQRWLGAFEVIGITGTERSEGEVPNKKLPHWVFK